MNQESTPLPTAQEELPRVRAFREAKEKAVAATLEALTIGGPARERAADEACRYLVNHFHEWMQPPAAIVASQGAGGGDRRVLQEALADLDATSWECPRCGHSEDCGTMDVAHAIRDHLAATPSEEPAQGEDWDGVLIDRKTLHAALRELVVKIEACGASVALTRASSLACHIMRAIGNRWNPPDPNGQREVNAAIDASRTAATPSEQGEAVAWQFRHIENPRWSWCRDRHDYERLSASPHYKTRALYAAGDTP